MKRLFLCVLIALATAAFSSGSAFAKPNPNPGKTTICHLAGGKYVAITVSNSALRAHSAAHHQDIVSGLPQSKESARQHCNTQGALTARQGGKKLSTNLTSTVAGLTGDLSLRLRRGQGTLCFALNVRSTGSTPITVSGVSLVQGSSAPINLSLTGLTTTGPSPLALRGCMPVNRDTIRSMLTSGTPISVTVTTSGGSLTGSITR